MPEANPNEHNPSPPFPARNAGAPGFLSREHILEATARCFRERGYDGATIREIAKHLGCAVGSIYRYFPDKRSLLLAMADDLFRPLADDLEHHRLPLQSSIQAYIQRTREHRHAYQLWFWLTPQEEALPATLGRIIDAWARLLASPEAAHRLWALLHGMITLDRPDDHIHAALATVLPPQDDINLI